MVGVNRGRRLAAGPDLAAIAGADAGGAVRAGEAAGLAEPLLAADLFAVLVAEVAVLVLERRAVGVIRHELVLAGPEGADRDAPVVDRGGEPAATLRRAERLAIQGR